MKALDLPDPHDFVRLQLALSHLDPATRRDFEEKYTSQTIPTYDNLISFVTERCRREELLSSESKLHVDKPIEVMKDSHKSFSAKPKFVGNTAPVSSSGQKIAGGPTNISRPIQCWNCGERDSHMYAECPHPRRRFCYRCGRSGVSIPDCPSSKPGNCRGNQQ